MSASVDRIRPSLLRRLTAIVYDSLLVVALVAVVNGIGLAAVVQLSGGEREVLAPLEVQALTMASIVGFFTLFWRKTGQTLGMQAWRIKLVNTDGNTPSITQCLMRCAAAVLSIGCLGLGYLWCLVDRDRRSWHDRLSGTDLVLLPRDRDAPATSSLPE